MLQKNGVGYTGTINGNRLENCPLRNKLQEKKVQGAALIILQTLIPK